MNFWKKVEFLMIISAKFIDKSERCGYTKGDLQAGNRFCKIFLFLRGDTICAVLLDT